MKKKTLLTAFAIFAIAGLLFAHPHRGGRGGGPEGRGAGIEAIVDLTAEQKEAVEALRADARSDMQAMREQLHRKAAQYWSMREQGDPRAAELRSEVETLREDIGLRRAALRGAIHQVLTPEQIEKLRSMRPRQTRGPRQ